MSVNQNACHLTLSEKKSGKYKLKRHFGLLLFEKFLIKF